MQSWIRALGLATFVVLIAIAVALGTVRPTASTPSASGAASVRPSVSPTTALAARDADVAFWEARLAAGGGFDTTLRLVDALIERARATGNLADLSVAGDALDAVADDAPLADAGFALRRGRIAFALHDFTLARASAAEALALDPVDPAALALAADAALEMGDLVAADVAYSALATDRRPPVLSRLARRAWLGGDVAGAEELVREAIAAASFAEEGDELAFYHYQLAEMLRGRNALDDAEAEYRAALDAQPDHVPSMGGLALVHAARGDDAEAIQLLEAATARLPAPDLVAALGDLYAIGGRAAEAEDQWALVERIAAIGEANGGVYDRQLVLFLADHERDPRRAVEKATAEIALRSDVYGHDALAWALFRAGRLEEADAEARAALALGTPDGRLRYHAGLIAEALGRDEDAREHLAFADAHSAALAPLQRIALAAALERLDR